MTSGINGTNAPDEPDRYLRGCVELGRLHRNGRGSLGGRAADGGAAEDSVAVVEDGGLAPGHAARWAVQADANRLAV